MKSDYPDVPVSKRNSQSAYDDTPGWAYAGILFVAFALMAVALVTLPSEGDHGQRIPTGIGGSDRGTR